MYGFQNNLTQLFSLMSISAIWNFHSGSVRMCVFAYVFASVRAPIRSTGFVPTITSIFMDGFQNNLAKLPFETFIQSAYVGSCIRVLRPCVCLSDRPDSYGPSPLYLYMYTDFKIIWHNRSP